MTEPLRPPMPFHPDDPPEENPNMATGPEGIALPPPAPSAPVETMATQAASLSTTLNPRLAPQDVDAERSVLGGVLLTNDALFDVLELLKPEDFYREPHRKIFIAMTELSMRNEGIDVLTLGDELRRQGELEAIGGPSYISSLDAFVPATANLGRYARIVAAKALRRRMIEAAHSIARDGYDNTGTETDFCDAAQALVMGIAEHTVRGDLRHSKEAVKRVYAQLEKDFEKQTDVTGLASGFEYLDRMTTGWQPGTLTIVGGRPAMGKTSVVMNMAAHVAFEKALPVAVFSLEMTEDELTQRLFASEARVDLQRIRNGKLLDSDFPKLARAADRIHKGCLYVDDTPAVSVLEIRAKCRRLKLRCPDLALVVVDYLQLMKSDGRAESREQEVAQISKSLKSLAKELKVPVIALCQLNRGLERREDKRPELSDLRESGSLEQDADIIVFVYRDEVYDEHSPDKGKAELIVRKHRNGATGTVPVAFLNDYVRFEDLAWEQQAFRGAQ